MFQVGFFQYHLDRDSINFIIVICHFADPLPVQQMYNIVDAGDPSHRNKLVRYRGIRGSSALEGFHRWLADILEGRNVSLLLASHLLSEHLERVNIIAGINNLGHHDFGMFQHEILQHIHQINLDCGWASPLDDLTWNPLPLGFKSDEYFGIEAALKLCGGAARLDADRRLEALAETADALSHVDVAAQNSQIITSIRQNLFPPPHVTAPNQPSPKEHGLVKALQRALIVGAGIQLQPNFNSSPGSATLKATPTTTLGQALLKELAKTNIAARLAMEGTLPLNRMIPDPGRAERVVASQLRGVRMHICI